MANKKKKQNTHASGSGSIISNYFESQDKLYERDMQGQKIASETRAKADSYYGEDKKYSDTDYTNQSESRYRRLAEKAVEIKERTQKNSEKYKRTNTLIRNAAKAENNMLFPCVHTSFLSYFSLIFLQGFCILEPFCSSLCVGRLMVTLI